MRAAAVLICVMVACGGCSRVADGLATPPPERVGLYPELHAIGGKLPGGTLLTGSQIREISELPRLEPGQAVDAMFRSTTDATVCAAGYSLAEIASYEKHEAARIELYVEESEVARLHTVGNAVVTFSDDATARQQFQRFNGLMARCDATTSATHTQRDPSSWKLSITSADTADEVAWTRSVVDSSWTCYMAARQRANFVASSMFCTHGSDNKAGNVLDRLTLKLSGAR
ncbi:sensor domain-containing protein [Mycobacteroides chelonae]|uniref:Sensor domain-containing protein n=1 Tax=Mycobacteroides chelonae TaxID=1774 RepID=A0AB73U9V2_MYCCH|nr:sensor domain-containing protein [Mycobacteroides chelonae]MEC4841414.1 sensor domain-containing protein [Mycobacteroides chelonae]MEC4846241.1 sensor domain-containing protein [Mycobacteroides chelonae]MEC4855357.1 sensor domain-containing protein [Mycobacteroides chelonae]MEC4871778.1 sensor domain-containing protein [Mycobacteroides chelonae]OLT77345.1 sensor domain-containing protein [Mycobacteroides chelonae]